MSLKAFFKPVMVSGDLESEQTHKKLKLDSCFEDGRQETMESPSDDIAVMDPSWKKVLRAEFKKDYYIKASGHDLSSPALSSRRHRLFIAFLAQTFLGARKRD